MVATQIKEEIVDKLEKVDLTVLRAINALLDVHTEASLPEEEEESYVDSLEGENPIVGYEIDGTPISLDEMKKQLEASRQEYIDGNSRTVEEVFKEKMEWIKSTK